MRRRKPASEKEVRDLKRRVGMRFFDYPGVVGVGVVEDPPGAHHLAVYLESDQFREGLPATIDGHEVAYLVSGPIRFQASG